jgi:hypothetical protein
LTAEISLPDQGPAMMGIMTNLSLGGCYVETSAILLPGSQAKLTFSVDSIAISLLCEVVRMDMGIGAALKFAEETQESRTNLQRILEKIAGTEEVLERQAIRNAAAGQGL